VLIFVQNSRSFTRGCDGAPGDRIGARPVTSFIQFDGLPTTPSDQVLLPPVEPSQYRAIRYTERLAEADAVASVGTVGDSYDNAMAEALNSLFKAECIRNPVMRPKGGWASVRDVEIAVAEYVDWYNRRLHGEIGHVPPAEFEAAHWASHKPVSYVGEQVPVGAGSR